MKALCLPRSKADAMKQALRSGDITIDSLYEMDSASRRIIFAQYVGDDFAPSLNAKFEASMLSKQKDALAKWVKTATSVKEPVRRDMLTRVERLKNALNDKAKTQFVADLAEMKLGVSVTEEEAQALMTYAKQIKEAKAKIPDSYKALQQAPDKISDIPNEVLEFAVAQDRFTNLTRLIIDRADSPTIKEYLYSRQYDAIIDTANVMKSAAASIDLSFPGRQGINLLLRGHIKQWSRGFAQNLKAYGRTLFEKMPKTFAHRSDAEMRAMMVSIYSEPNFINGKYQASRTGYGLGVTVEEAFPSSLPGRIPVAGRVFHASENAFNTTALFLRKEMANKWIALAESNGQDVFDPKVANGLSQLVLTGTGRGPLHPMFAMGAKEINAGIFSIRYWSALLDIMSFNMLSSDVRRSNPAVRKLAAMEGLRFYRNLAAVYAMAYAINPDSVPWLKEGGSNASNFGRIKISENFEIDPTGGLVGHVRVISQLLSGWKYNGKDYTWTDLDENGFGVSDRLGLFAEYIYGKGSPFVKALGDAFRGTNFEGEEISPIGAFISAGAPITSETVLEQLQSGNSDAMFAVIMENFGLSPYAVTIGGYGDKWLAIKEMTTPAEFNSAVKEYTANYQEKAQRLRESYRWESMDFEEQQDALRKLKMQEANRIYQRYGVR